MRKGFWANGDGESYLGGGAVPLGSLLPAVYQEYDENALRLTSGLDGVLAPVWLSIDCYDAYLSPAMTPEDVTEWLATWVGIVAADIWQPEGVARLVEQSFELHRWRGTRKGMADLIEAYTGIRPEVEDNGGVTVSATPGTVAGGSDRAAMVVRMSRQSLGDDDAEREERLERLNALVDATTPAHVLTRVQLT